MSEWVFEFWSVPFVIREMLTLTFFKSHQIRKKMHPKSAVITFKCVHYSTYGSSSILPPHSLIQSSSIWPFGLYMRWVFAYVHRCQCKIVVITFHVCLHDRPNSMLSKTDVHRIHIYTKRKCSFYSSLQSTLFHNVMGGQHHIA